MGINIFLSFFFYTHKHNIMSHFIVFEKQQIVFLSFLHLVYLTLTPAGHFIYWH